MNTILAPIVLLLVAVAGSMTRPAATFDHSAFDAILRAAVRDELVDYQLIRDRYRDQLKAYLATYADLDPSTLPRDVQLALYVNLYNAAMIDAVVDRYVPWYIVTEKNGAVWKEPFIRLNGELVSLDHVEHTILRKQLGDPRIHAALNCAGLSCPPLPPRAYTGADIDAELDQAMREWLLHPRHNRIDHERRKLTLSKIFLWYADDFGGRENLPAYLSKYVGRDLTGYDVAFFQYDFRLNDTSDEARP